MVCFETYLLLYFRSFMAKRSNNNKRPPKNRLKKLLRKAPSWALGIGGILIAAIYAAIFYYFFVGQFGLRWQAFYGDASYPNEYSIQGIDISHHQGEINWTKLQSATIGDNPIRFIIIKATEGADFLDENFNDNFYNARENGFIRGAYHYFKPNTPALLQAKYFLKQVHLEPGDLPPVLDIEEKGNLTAAQLKKAALTWLHTVEKKYGVKPIIYTNYKFKLQYLSDKDFNDYPYWIAHYYVKELKYKGKWKFWQHTDYGSLPGINGKVDFNVYNGSMYDLKKFTISKKEEVETE